MTPHHAFVWASAGTGKTHTLTLRALFLMLSQTDTGLYQEGARNARMRAARKVLQSVILVTFTRKAATEMQSRLFSYLDQIVNTEDLEQLRNSEKALNDPLFVEVIESVIAKIPGQSFSRLRKGVEALAELATNLQVSTLHSFATSLLARHPLESGIPPATRFADEDRDSDENTDEQLVDRWLRAVMARDDDQSRDLARVLQDIRPDTLKLWLAGISKYPWLRERILEAGFLNDTSGESLFKAFEALRLLANTNTGRKLTKLIRETNKLSELIQHARSGRKLSWVHIATHLNSNKDYYFPVGKESGAVSKLIADLPDEDRHLLEDREGTLQTAAQLALSHDLSEGWSAWERLAKAFSEWAQSGVLRELGLLTFGEIIRLAAHVLERNPQVQQAEYTRVKALLVDEFQDTDRDQIHLLTRLLKRPSQAGEEVIGFFVGDPKQSIYRFRGADISSVDAFFHGYESLIDARLPKSVFQLQTNFRSSQQICEFTNFFFTDILGMAKPSEHLIPFRSNAADRPRWLKLEPHEPVESLRSDQSQQLKARATVQIIQEYISGATSEMDRRFKDILILTRRNDGLKTLLPELRKAQIPTISSGSNTFYLQSEVLDLLNLLIALMHPQDGVAIASVLRCPVVGMSSEQIHRLFQMIPSGEVLFGRTPLPEELPAEVGSRIERLRSLQESRLATLLPDWLLEVRKLIPLSSYTQPEDLEGLPAARMTHLLKTFHDVCRNGDSSPIAWLLKQREQANQSGFWNAKFGEDVSVSDESINAVRVMTIHKAKGLEAKLVIVFEWDDILNASQRASSSGILEMTAPNGTMSRAFSMKWGPLNLASANWEQARELDKEGSAEESLRLAYVAVTRAKERLVLFSVPAYKTNLLPKVRDLLGQEPEEAIEPSFDLSTLKVQTLGFEAEEEKFSLDRDSHARLWRSRLETGKRTGTLLRNPTDDADDQVLGLSVTERSPRHLSPAAGTTVGQLVHLYLERHLTDSHFDEALFARLPFPAGQAPVPENVRKLAMEILHRFFSSCLKDSHGRPYQDRVISGRIMAREMPLFCKYEGSSWYGIVDLLLLEGDILTVVDFKTTPPKKVLPLTYSRQSKIYQQAVQQLFPKDTVRFEFWWLGAEG